MMKSGLIRLLHGVRMMRTFGDILRRLVPARSAPVYVHQLQTNATIFGSNAAPATEASVDGDVDMGTPGAPRPAAGASARQEIAPALLRPEPELDRSSGTSLLGPMTQHPACQLASCESRGGWRSWRAAVRGVEHRDRKRS